MNKPVDAPAGAYARLEQRFRRLSALREAAGMLQWDLSTVMPDGGRPARAEQLATLDVVCHEILTDPLTGDLLDEADAEAANLSDWQHANLKEMRRSHTHATALDAGLVEAMSKAATACEAVWREARPKADFAAVYPLLSEVLNLMRQAAAAKAEKLGCSPYEALMDQYEPGAREADIDRVFADYGAFLPDFLPRVLEHQARRGQPIEPKGPFPQAVQKDLAKRVMERLGFDFRHGRLDESHHPFCGGVPEDVRITTRYREDQFVQALMGVIHETGHALYERNLPVDWRLQPVGSARGMVVHESQSLLMEMQAARSAQFCRYLSGLLRETFPGIDGALSPENLQLIYSRVEPGFIRVDADEVTYPAHIILRYQIEKALFRGELQLADVPGVWREEFKKLLGLDVPSDREGILQDVHWYDGAFGYFPCYSLGAMTAAQLFDAACQAHPEIPAEIEQGKFTTLQGWLKTNVHSLGSSLTTPEIVTRATGRPLDVNVFKRHLERRYLS
ncbi:carboxypeptidase M32 [Dongia deserti]|uniref:carboxypeptidase M32 n=1 Tax=Dongia deserti TaxID=2268030 RepID=UPI000E64EE05|nr:carboxypeptidase M32 [Dongia deserti]